MCGGDSIAGVDRERTGHDSHGINSGNLKTVPFGTIAKNVFVAVLYCVYNFIKPAVYSIFPADKPVKHRPNGKDVRGFSDIVR